MSTRQFIVSRFRVIDVDWPTTGPCVACGATCERYGEAGAPFCSTCKQPD